MRLQPVRSPATMASGVASRGQIRASLAAVAVALVLTLMLLPVAATPGPVMPGFMLLHQTALIVTYGLGTWMLYAQFLRSRAVSLLLAAGGTLFTTAIVALQLLSIPGVFAPGRLLGNSSATTTWLWTAWHIGPPIWGLAAAATLLWRPGMVVSPRFTGHVAAAAAAAALGLACGWAVMATVLLPWLPTQVTGGDYRAVITSGVGPAVEALTVAALVAMALVTHGRRSTLDVWIIAALALLVLDNALTLAGGMRDSIGWTMGRVLALASAGAVIWAYLHEVESLRARAEAAFEGLVAAEAKLRAAQKMEAVGQLTGGIAHDFNNLLMVVTSGFDMIRRRPDDRARVLKMAEAGLQATERGARLTRQLLSFARRQPLRPETVSPNNELEDFEPLIARAAGESVQVTFALDAKAHPVKIDPTEFEAAVLNLVANACEALAPQGGHVTVSSQNRVLTQETADGALKPGDYVVVAITDDGPGMSQEVAGRAFEPFFTTKDFGKGSGMGLAQVYGFARVSGGEAVIHTEQGHGATVELWLPRAPAFRSAAAIDGTGRQVPLRQVRAGEVVLAVEDEPAILAAVVENLTDLGYQVLAARDADEALRRLREADRVDVLFSDIVMPGGMNGVQLATEATRLWPDLRVLLTSGYANQALAGQPDLPRDLDVLPKPYRRAELASRLRLVTRAA